MTTTLRAADGTRIVAETKGEGPLTFVLAHGITGSRQKSGVQRITDWLAQHGRVVYFDERGHGDSSGTCTLSYREPLDLDAACAWAKSMSTGPVVTMGFSMGASVALRHAALASAPDRVTVMDRAIPVVHAPDATVLVSGVAEWFFRGSNVMDRLFRLTSTPWGRLALRTTQGVRLSVRDWGAGPLTPAAQLPTSPEACAALIRRPLLLVHGDHDHYFPPEHSERVHRAAVLGGNARAELWIEPGMGHAERGTTHSLAERMANWAEGVVGA
jgi:pimeloyl-ACP methyl ester carboxylesterase